MAAIVGYILGESYTKPEIGEIMVGEGDNLVYIRRSGAVGFEGIQSLEDLKLGLEREIKELDRQISERRRAAALARSLAEKLEAQKAIRELEEVRKKKRHDFFQSQDAIDANRDTLIADMEKQLQESHVTQQVFIFRWSSL